MNEVEEILERLKTLEEEKKRLEKILIEICKKRGLSVDLDNYRLLQ